MTTEAKGDARIICYLCGGEIVKGRSRDHIPPQQFFAPAIRQKFNLDRLLTIPAHRDCNRSYGDDEEYFAWSLAPLARGSVAGSALLYDHVHKTRSGRKAGLSRKIFTEFGERFGSLYLPSGWTGKRFDRERVERVTWKIVRGLFYLRTQQLLPISTPYFIELVGPGNEPRSDWFDFWDAVRAQPSEGSYQAIFAHKYLEAVANDDPAGPRLHLWGMLLWDRLMIFVAHHDPSDETEQGRRR